jgi:hypothetical protein
MERKHVRAAYLLLAPLLACTAPNPAYVSSHDARTEPPRRDADADFQPDSSAAEGPGGDAPVGVYSLDGGDAVTRADGGPAASGLVLHWRFDEPTGAAALDSSGQGFEGTYSGSPIPGVSTEAAPTTFANPGSRRFDATAGNSVQLASMPSALRPTQGLTVTVWFRTTQTTRADLVSHGGDYFIRWNNGGVLEFVRRRPPGSASTWVSASGPAPTGNDGNWHHAAGVTSVGGGVSIYMDGTLVDRDISNLPFTYLTPSTLCVGRSMSGSQPFDGWMDEVRIYDRALSVDQLRALARGEPCLRGCLNPR